MVRADPLARFWVRVQEDPETGCWLWTGALSGGTGYASFSGVGGHVFAYRTFVGPVPAGLEIDHLCRVKHCVAPWHLEPVTHQENNRRARLARQTTCAQGHPLTDDNLYRLSTRPGQRICLACKLARQARYYRNHHPSPRRNP